MRLGHFTSYGDAVAARKRAEAELWAPPPDRRTVMAVVCRITGHALPYRCGDCRGYCIEQPGMTTETLKASLSPEPTEHVACGR